MQLCWHFDVNTADKRSDWLSKKCDACLLFVVTNVLVIPRGLLLRQQQDRPGLLLAKQLDVDREAAGVLCAGDLQARHPV